MNIGSALLLAGVIVVVVGTTVTVMLGVSLWRLIARRPSKTIALANSIVALGFGVYLVRALHWWATGDLLAAEWEHVVIPVAGLAAFGALGVLHHRGVRRDPSAL